MVLANFLRNSCFSVRFQYANMTRTGRNIMSVLLLRESKKLALIVVANKLLKQAFAIAKSGLFLTQFFVSKCFFRVGDLSSILLPKH